VDDAFGVRRIERVSNLDRQIEQQIQFHRTTSDAMIQRLALHELHGDETTPAVFGYLVNRADVGMVQRRGSAGFSSQTFECLRVFREVLGRNSARHDAEA